MLRFHEILLLLMILLNLLLHPVCATINYFYYVTDINCYYSSPRHLSDLIKKAAVKSGRWNFLPAVSSK